MIILADNQVLTRMGIVALLPPKSDYCVAKDRAFLATLLASHPEARVVLDFALFDFESAEQLLIFVRRFPRVQWLLLSSEFSHDLLRLFASETVVNFVDKEADGPTLNAAIAATLQGRHFVSPAVCALLSAKTEQQPASELLTATETAILQMIAKGLSSRDIAEQRHISIHTVTTHRKNIFRKLHVNTSYEATRYAARAGLVDLMEYYI